MICLNNYFVLFIINKISEEFLTNKELESYIQQLYNNTYTLFLKELENYQNSNKALNEQIFIEKNPNSAKNKKTLEIKYFQDLINNYGNCSESECLNNDDNDSSTNKYSHGSLPKFLSSTSMLKFNIINPKNNYQYLHSKENAIFPYFMLIHFKIQNLNNLKLSALILKKLSLLIESNGKLLEIPINPNNIELNENER